KKRAMSLSGGERRRLEITRSLVTNPSFLLLDEPFANIDPIAIHDVKQMIKLLAKKNISVFITDHNAREIFSLVDRSYIVREGKIMLSGNVDELINNEEARKHYLGSEFRL
ncbi:MAG: ATP-binding cassette domain-containing protein, partial [Waddliaceae bacterium]|nr:ATP-binding cassette domain-containing protein [Waddliaceae bacterium]